MQAGIPVLRKLRLEDGEFQASLGYLRPILKVKKKKNQTGKIRVKSDDQYQRMADASSSTDNSFFYIFIDCHLQGRCSTS
jgi:hypothetical protein